MSTAQPRRRGKPQFVRGSSDIYLNTDKGLEAVSPDGLHRRAVKSARWRRPSTRRWRAAPWDRLSTSRMR